MRAMIQPGRFGALVLALALVLAAAPVSAGQVQDFEPGFYASELLGVEIEVSGPLYEITEAEIQHYPTGEGEIVRIGSDSLAANLEVSFFDDGDTAQESVDIYLQSMESATDSMEVIDRGVDGNLHYVLAMTTYDGFDILYYVQVEEDVQGNVDMLQSMLGASQLFEADLTDAQAEVTVDGVPFLENLDAAQVAEVIDGNGSLTEGEDATPAPAENTVTFEGSGVTVGIGPDFSFVGEPDQGTDVEAVRIQGPDTLSMVAIGETDATTQVVLDSFSGGIASNYEGAETAYEEISDEYAWRLLTIPGDMGDVTFMLIVVDTTRVPGYELMHAHEVPDDSVAGSLAVIQEQITLNDAPLMPEIDPEEIAVVADRAADDESTQTPVTPEATEDVTEEDGDQRSGDPREDARLPEGEDASDERGNTSETGRDNDVPVAPTEEPDVEVSDVPGELTDSSWEGAVFGNVIEWDPEIWFVDTEYDGDLVSDEENQVDTIVLQSESPNGTSWLYVTVYGGEDTTPLEYLEYWISDDYLAVFTDAGAEVEVVESRTRGSSTAVMLKIIDEGEEYLVVRQASVLESGEVVVATLDTPAADMADMYVTAQDVTMNGANVLQVYSPSQIQRTIGD